MNEQQFRKKLTARATASAALFVIGVCLCVYFTLNGKEGGGALERHYTNGFISGITAAGLLIAVKNMVIFKMPKLFRRYLIAESDERNRQISLKAWAWTGYIGVFLILASTLFVPGEVIRYLVNILCVLLMIYLAVYKFLQMKM